jgi:hypothetical protein
MRTHAGRSTRTSAAPPARTRRSPSPAAGRGLDLDAELQRAETFGHRFERLAPAGAPPAPAAGGLSLQGLPIQRGKKEGGKQRQKKRQELTKKIKKKQLEKALKGTDYILDEHGFPRKPQPGLATSKFFTTAREAQEATPAAAPGPVALDTSTLSGQAQGVLSLASTFIADRSKPVAATTTGGTHVGEISKSNLPWFNIPDDAGHGAGEPSGFAKPVDAGNKKQRTTYDTDAGIFGSGNYDSTTPEDQGRRLLVSATESIRAPGAGLAQVLAEQTRDTAGIASRNDLYGTEGSPGYAPAGYKGSQADIVLTEDLAEEGEHEKVLENPTGLQTEGVLAAERRQRYVPRLTRSLSEPRGTATEEHHRRDTEEVFDRLGLRNRLKRQRSEI